MVTDGFLLSIVIYTNSFRMVRGYVNRGFNLLFLTIFFWFDTYTIAGNPRQISQATYMYTGVDL